MSVKSPVCIQRYSLLNMSQNNRKQRKINTKYWFLLGKTRSYTHISYIILKLVLWRIWICNNLEKQLLLLYAHFVIAGHICSLSKNHSKIVSSLLKSLFLPLLKLLRKQSKLWNFKLLSIFWFYNKLSIIHSSQNWSKWDHWSISSLSKTIPK